MSSFKRSLSAPTWRQGSPCLEFAISLLSSLFVFTIDTSVQRLTNAVDVVRGNAVKNTKKVTAVSKRVDVLEVRQQPNTGGCCFRHQPQSNMKTNTKPSLLSALTQTYLSHSSGSISEHSLYLTTQTSQFGLVKTWFVVRCFYTRLLLLLILLVLGTRVSTHPDDN